MESKRHDNREAVRKGDNRKGGKKTRKPQDKDTRKYKETRRQVQKLVKRQNGKETKK